jgi:membrane protease YdiL (CAAX protease family)
MVMRKAARAPIWVSLGLIVLYPFFASAGEGVFRGLSHSIGSVAAHFAIEATIWLYGAAVLAIALYWERRTLSSIGLRRPTWSSLGFGVAGAVAMAGAIILGGMVVYGWLHQPEHEDAQVAAIVGGSAVYAVCLAVRAGVIEEILFRGLAIEQLTVLTGRKWLSALLATLVFVIAHMLHFDWAQLVPVSAVSIVIVCLYLWRKDLWANIIAHTLIDLIAVLAVVFHIEG